MSTIPFELEIIYKENPTTSEVMFVIEKYRLDNNLCEIHLSDINLLASCYETCRQYYHEKHSTSTMTDIGEYLALKT